MCLPALTGTEHITFDFRGTCGWCTTGSYSYCYHGISFYAAYLTTAIDGTVYRAVTNVDIGSASHDCFSALECTGTTLCSFTFATAEHVTCDEQLGSSFINAFPLFCSRIVLRADVHISVTCHINMIIYHIILTHISKFTSAKDITGYVCTDVSAYCIFLST